MYEWSCPPSSSILDEWWLDRRALAKCARDKLLPGPMGINQSGLNQSRRRDTCLNNRLLGPLTRVAIRH